MKEKKWYYGSSDQKKGPITSSDLKAMFHEGALPRETLVCEEGSDRWIPIEDVESAFVQTLVDAPDPKTREKDIPHEEENESKTVHPWHRFWARILDYIIFAFVLRLIFSVIPLPVIIIYPPFAFIALIFLYSFIEAALLCSWTSTIGKSLFGIYIRNEDGSKLSYRSAISRSLSVWWLGLGAGFPIVILITMIVACVKLSNNKITTWDKNGKYHVEHRKLTGGKITAIVILYVLLSYALIPYISATSTVYKERTYFNSDDHNQDAKGPF